jgi:hypothetical protein
MSLNSGSFIFIEMPIGKAVLKFKGWFGLALVNLSDSGPKATSVIVIILLCLSTIVLRWTPVVQATSWSIEFVDSRGDYELGGFALNASGYPRVLLNRNFNGSIIFSKRWISWENETVASSFPVNSTALAIDGNDVPHIAMRNFNNVWYAKWNGTAWPRELLETNPEESPQAWISMAVDRMGRPHIVYQWGPLNSTTLRYAHWNGTSWIFENVDSGLVLGIGCRIALDSQDYPRVAYMDMSSTPAIKYARRNDSTWIIETVFSDLNVIPGGFAVDTMDRPHVSFYNSSSGDLMYAIRNDTAWSVQVVDSTGRVGWESALILDAGNRPHISYEENPVGPPARSLKYARWNGSAWIIETVDSTESVGRFSDIKIGPAGRVDIAYERDFPIEGVKYAYGYPVNHPPVSHTLTLPQYWYNVPTLTIDATVVDVMGVQHVDLYYRFDGGSGWTAWSILATDYASPWQWTFPWPDGEGRYEFCSIAFDGSEWEMKPPNPEAVAGYDATPPVSAASPISPYWHSMSPLTISATASDNLSGVWNVTLLYSYSSDNNATWSAWTPFGTDSSVPWSWQFPFPDGVGHYRFHTIATDNASNVEGGKTVAEVVAGYGTMPDYLPVNPNPSSPQSIFTSSLLQLSVEVRNDGGIPGSSSSVLAFLDSVNPSSPFVTFQIPPLSPGETAGPFTADWTSPAAPCSCTVTARVDYGDDLVESNEANNEYMWIVDVEPAPITAPDYVPVQGEPASPLRIGMSGDIPLSIVVHNQGNGTTTDNAIVAFFQQSSPPFSTFVLSPLAPSANSSRFTATWMSPSIPGTYSVSVDVDYYNNVSEWDETNNVNTWTIEVVAGPITSLVIGNPNYTSTATYVKSTTPLSLSVLDQSGLGIRNTTYTVDGGNTVNYTATGTFFLFGEGVHKIEWRSLDWAGNLEDVSSMNLTVDDTPPATTIHKSEEQATTATLFTLTATDSGCGANVTRYRIDGGSWAVYSGGFTLPEGVHNISYYSNDMLNNTEKEKWLVVTVSGSLPPVEVAVNYKSIVALIFAIILLVAGVWSSKRRPWKGGKDRMAVVKAFAITSMPFVLAEAATGMLSLLTGQLSMPPLVGAGTAVDLAILLAGIVVAILRIVRTRSSGAGETSAPQKR